jgi:hypothetical protein
MALRGGVPADGLALLLPAARETAAADPSRALRLLLAAREAAFHATEPGATAEIASIVDELPALEDPEEEVVARVLRTLGDPSRDREAVPRAGGDRHARVGARVRRLR